MKRPQRGCVGNDCLSGLTGGFWNWERRQSAID
jgi:hypothetical protein